jgi:hypothetical protein
MANVGGAINNNDADAGNAGGGNNGPIQPELVVPTVSKAKLNNNGFVMKASDCVVGNTNEGEVFASEKNVLKGVLLSIKHGSTAKISAKGYILSPYSGQGVKRQKVAIQLPYNRIAVFGDLNDPPNCFAVLTETNEESRFVFHNIMLAGAIAIGGVYYILEPRETDKMLGSNTPIIPTTLEILPLMLSTPNVTIEENLPQQDIWTHQEPGTESFFVYHGTHVDINYFQLLMDKRVSCSGRLCDRALPSKTMSPCPCFHTGTMQGLVGEYNVTLPVPAELSATEHHVVQFCRSLRTTELFFENLNQFVKKEDIVEERFANMRLAVRAMQDHVNANHGWTVVGWFQKGEVEDSATPGEKIDSLKWTLHISLLVPTSSHIRNRLDVAFNPMRIKLAAPFVEANYNPNNNDP